MFLLKHLKYRIAAKRFKGTSFVEVMIVMVVLGLAVWAIMLTVSSSASMYMYAKISMNSRVLANSWFEVFESIPPETVDSSFTMNNAADYVADFMHATSKNYPQYVIQGYNLTVIGDEPGAAPNGVRTVALSVKMPESGAALFELERRINARSNDNASDDKPGGE